MLSQVNDISDKIRAYIYIYIYICVHILYSGKLILMLLGSQNTVSKPDWINTTGLKFRIDSSNVIIYLL